MKALTSKEAAARLGITPAHVRRLCLDGVLPAEKFGRDWILKPADVEAARARPGRGRPKGKAKGD
jgi:excisionase family DNA binding protein